MLSRVITLTQCNIVLSNMRLRHPRRGSKIQHPRHQCNPLSTLPSNQPANRPSDKHAQTRFFRHRQSRNQHNRSSERGPNLRTLHPVPIRHSRNPRRTETLYRKLSLSSYKVHTHMSRDQRGSHMQLQLLLSCMFPAPSLILEFPC